MQRLLYKVGYEALLTWASSEELCLLWAQLTESAANLRHLLTPSETRALEDELSELREGLLAQHSAAVWLELSNGIEPTTLPEMDEFKG